MKRTKLRRSRRSVFGRRRMPQWLKAVVWLLVCAVVVAAGYFGAMMTTEGGLSKPDAKPSQSDKPAASPTTQEKPTTTTKPDKPEEKPEETPPLSDGTIRAFYLPSSELSVDTLSEMSTFHDAAAAGFNAVIFDLKDAKGTLYYKSSCSQAKKAKPYADNALSAKNLTALFTMMREAGLQPIPRLYAFCDDLAAKELADARIMLESNHGWSWYDGDPNNGGRRWLNPYSKAAHDYIGSLSLELKELGAAAILLDGVEFPVYTGSAYFGEEAATISKSDILTTFVEKTRSLLGDSCPLLLSCSEKSALGTDTKVYGGNPLTFGAGYTSPILSAKSKSVKENMEKMLFRAQGPDAKNTILVPTVPMSKLSTKQINRLLADCAAIDIQSFFLYAPDGEYDFAAYDLP